MQHSIAPPSIDTKLNPDSGKRNAGIDYLRAFSIMLVLGNHYFGFLKDMGLGDSGLAKPFQHGYFGVTIFFCISGFLIANSSLQRRSDSLGISIAWFYIRRATRILPLLWLDLFIGLAFLQFAPQEAAGFHTIFAAQPTPFSPLFWISILAFGFNWMRIAVDPASSFGLHWDVLWSLAVEEQFYLIFPASVLLLRTIVRLRFALIAVLVSAILWRAHLILSGADWLVAFTGSFSCFDALALGVLTALLPPWGRKASIIAGIGGGVLVLICGLVKWEAFGGVHITGLALGAACLIQSSRTLAIGLDRKIAPVRAFGRLSYGLYLLHPMMLFLLGPVILAMPPFAGLIVFVAAVFAVASLSAFAFERPMERWLRPVLFGRFSAGPPRKAV